MSTYPVVDWNGLYGEGWGEDIIPEAFSHPAKYSRALIRHIYQYLIDNGMLKRGDKVLDCFGGVALGALDAQLQGLHYTGIELEEKFVRLGNQNIDMWNRKYRPHFPRFGTAILLQGDSRRIGEVVRGAEGVISSPPYEDRDVFHLKGDFGKAYREHGAGREDGHLTDDYGTSPGQLGAMASGDVNAILSSPPFGEHVVNPKGIFEHEEGCTCNFCSRNKGNAGFIQGGQEYGMTEGQLGEMSTNDFSAVISSPPFIQTSGGTNVTSPEGPLADPSLISRHSAGNAAMHGYGEAKGQMQAMKEGDIDAVINSLDYRNDEGYNSSYAKEKEFTRQRNNQTIPGGDVHKSVGQKVSCEPSSNYQPHEKNGREDEECIRGESNVYPEGRISTPEVLDGKETTKGYGREQSEENKGRESLPMEGRRVESGLSQGNQKGEVRGVRSEAQPLHTPQGLQSLQQRSGKLASDVRELSHEFTQDEILGVGQEGRETQEVQQDSGVESVDGVISSPPYEGGQVGRGEVGNRKSTGGSDGQPDKVLDAMQHGYSDTPENLGNSEGDTFWSAALTIVSECYKLLAPGAVAVFICKDYVRNKKIVPFSDQWRMLCEKVGFVTITEVHAMLTEDNGTQMGMLDTQNKEYKIKRASFFRRLAEKKGSPPIDYETVWILIKPKSSEQAQTKPLLSSVDSAR